MAMQQNGLAKLTEELGELQQVIGRLQQVIGKMLQYPELQLTDGEHPDGTVLRRRFEEELADVEAAATFVAAKLKLDVSAIKSRAAMKRARFQQWDAEGKP